MADHVYKIVELAGSSSVSMQAAIENAVARAARTLHNLRWFEVVTTHGHLHAGKIAHWQVVVKIGFTLDEEFEVEKDSDSAMAGGGKSRRTKKHHKKSR